VYDLLTTEGVAILGTSQHDVERFYFQSNPTPQSMEDYDRYAMDTTNQQWGIPVRKFSKSSFYRAIEGANLVVVHWGQFRYIRPECLEWFAAKKGDISIEAMKDVGINQYAVVKRPHG
jgi:hypothetical protein